MIIMFINYYKRPTRTKRDRSEEKPEPKGRIAPLTHQGVDRTDFLLMSRVRQTGYDTGQYNYTIICSIMKIKNIN